MRLADYLAIVTPRTRIRIFRIGICSVETESDCSLRKVNADESGRTLAVDWTMDFFVHDDGIVVGQKDKVNG